MDAIKSMYKPIFNLQFQIHKSNLSDHRHHNRLTSMLLLTRTIKPP